MGFLELDSWFNVKMASRIERIFMPFEKCTSKYQENILILIVALLFGHVPLSFSNKTFFKVFKITQSRAQ